VAPIRCFAILSSKVSERVSLRPSFVGLREENYGSSGPATSFSDLSFFRNEPNVQAHADSLGVPDQGAHVDVFRSALGATELGSTGADLLGEFGLGKSLPLPLIGELEADAKNFGLSSKAWRTVGSASCWSR
jgi:hypothetical protein